MKHPLRLTLLATVLYLALLNALATGEAFRALDQPTPSPKAPSFTVAAYYFPNYHPSDARNNKKWGRPWTEWELVRAAKPRFPGHQQPNVPLWGETDESDPKAMAQKIAAAADHGINAFIFDWYYYDDGPFLNKGLDEGFLGAPNNQRLKFALMWANHDWLDIHPYTRPQPARLLYPGKVKPETFDAICRLVIEKYFKHPSYWTLDGKPYFSIYELNKLLENFGSVEATRAALDRFRQMARDAGLPGLHLNAVVWGQPILPGESTPVDAADLVKRLGFDSVTSYVWIHHVPLNDQKTDYGWAQQEYGKYWEKARGMFGVPYFPNVSVGWDSSPRADQSQEFGNTGYPFTNTISGNTPERFRDALAETKKKLIEQNGPYVLTVNSWNEWTEGSYLEPDTRNGLKYLEAVQSVFKAQEKTPTQSVGAGDASPSESGR
ncbi:MAG TPA: glycoside hydrolase family 99-like domain-containing protein [Candidatus Sumerlaeota bacterium]|nr:glycoside hydrolase family 99-like domain-containing protein [Candidatus Sumerlaeota bacterium]